MPIARWQPLSALGIQALLTSSFKVFMGQHFYHDPKQIFDSLQNSTTKKRKIGVKDPYLYARFEMYNVQQSLRNTSYFLYFQAHFSALLIRQLDILPDKSDKIFLSGREFQHYTYKYLVTLKCVCAFCQCCGK